MAAPFLINRTAWSLWFVSITPHGRWLFESREKWITLVPPAYYKLIQPSDVSVYIKIKKKQKTCQLLSLPLSLITHLISRGPYFMMLILKGCECVLILTVNGDIFPSALEGTDWMARESVPHSRRTKTHNWANSPWYNRVITQLFYLVMNGEAGTNNSVFT